MAILQVRDIDEQLYSSLKALAKLENRSLSQEVVTILEKYLSQPKAFEKNATKEFLALSGAWDDNRSPDVIVKELKKSRKASKRFGVKSGLFD